jgi:hypothetical protein
LVIIGVPLDVVVTRNARLPFDVDMRTARERDGDDIVAAPMLLLLVIPALPIVIGALAGADGIARLPTANDRCVVARTAAVVAVLMVVLFVPAVTGFAAMVGDGMPTDD